ncbi:unnamed protein product [Linum trigynum]|uniref:Uncharacterized protein n=1 Tax=Linum trigynum TaxID=586398 RepID=A0AAV2CVL2_9ROSI
MGTYIACLYLGFGKCTFCSRHQQSEFESVESFVFAGHGSICLNHAAFVGVDRKRRRDPPFRQVGTDRPCLGNDDELHLIESGLKQSLFRGSCVAEVSGEELKFQFIDMKIN